MLRAGPRYQLMSKAARVSYVRSFAFGVEDGLVSTVGLLAGVATADVVRRDILITGAILIIVEAFSMATGSFLSESEAETYESGHTAVRRPIVDGVIMFFSYFLAGLLALTPYILFEIRIAFPTSIVVSLIALAGLGIIGARISRVNLWRNALKMLLVGGVAVGVGVLIGRLLKFAV